MIAVRYRNTAGRRHGPGFERGLPSSKNICVSAARITRDRGPAAIAYQNGSSTMRMSKKNPQMKKGSRPLRFLS